MSGLWSCGGLLRLTKDFVVTVRFRMQWHHFDDSLTNYIMVRLKNEMAQHIDKLEIERILPTPKEESNTKTETDP